MNGDQVPIGFIETAPGVYSHPSRVPAQDGSDDQSRAPIQDPKLKHRPRKKPLRHHTNEKGGAASLNLRITRYGRRLFDDDNLFIKALVDRLREGGLIPNDDPGTIYIHRTCQILVKEKCQEKTKIEIWLTMEAASNTSNA